jgi:hypothetical protein
MKKIQGSFMNDLNKKSYPRDRWISHHPDEFYVITPKEFNSNVPISCPVCSTLMRSKDDENAWEEFNCCHRCSLAWAASRRQSWKDGWRPTIEQIDDELKQRPPMSIKFVAD